MSPEYAGYRGEYQSNPPGYFGWAGVTFAGIAYNRGKVKPEEAPKVWKDILKPAFKDGISAKLSTSGMQHMQWYQLRQIYGNDFWQEFAKQRPRGFDSRAQLFDRLAKGDDKVCALAEYAGYTLFKEKGADIEFVAPPDGLPATPIFIGVVNRAPHPEAARPCSSTGRSPSVASSCTRTTRSCSTARCGATSGRCRRASVSPISSSCSPPTGPIFRPATRRS